MGVPIYDKMDSHSNWNQLFVGIGIPFSYGSRYGQLIGFFGYMSVACTVIPLPTPPFVTALRQVIAPSIVALTGAVGNCISVFMEYHLLLWIFSKTKLEQRVESSRVFRLFSSYLYRAAFPCLVFTGFTPIPFEPFRFAAILIRYDMRLYLLSVLIRRFPRYYLIAYIGEQFQIPMLYLIILLIILLLTPIIGISIKHHTSVKSRKM